jgi:hypothetical protein
VKWITKLMNVVSKTASRKEVFSPSSIWNVTFAALIWSFASESMPSERSDATTLSALPARTCV